MVRLRNIRRNKGYILCLAFVENCQEPIQLALNESSAELDDYQLPKNYEWCTYHIAYAKRYLQSLIGKDIETQTRNIVWC